MLAVLLFDIYTAFMNFDRRVQDRLNAAERAEVISSEELFVADLRELLDGKAITEGIHIDFGDNHEALQRVLDLMDIEAMTGAVKYFNMINGTVIDGSSKANMSHKTVSPVVEAHGIRVAAELMQSDAWKVVGETFKHVQTMDERVTSWLMLMHASDIDAKDETFMLDANSTAVVVGVSARYQPESIDEYGENMGMASLYEQASSVKDYRQRITRLGELLEYDEAELELPSRHYFLRIGRVLRGDGTPAVFGFSPVDVYPAFGFYDLKNGRIVRNAERSRDDLS